MCARETGTEGDYEGNSGEFEGDLGDYKRDLGDSVDARGNWQVMMSRVCVAINSSDSSEVGHTRADAHAASMLPATMLQANTRVLSRTGVHSRTSVYSAPRVRDR